MADAAMRLLVGFARRLRDEGLTVGEGQIVDYCRAVGMLRPLGIDELFWAGQACLVVDPSDLPAYRRAFLSYFSGMPESRDRSAKEPGVASDGGEAGSSDGPRDGRAFPGPQTGEAIGELGAVASPEELLRHREFSRCTPEEMDAIRSVMTRFALAAPRRALRRTRASRRGRAVDLARTMRRWLRRPWATEMVRRRRTMADRRLTLVLDVSGSMSPYSRPLLYFAHAAASRRRKVEVFCFGTRLTRVTRELARRDVDRAFDEVAARVVDWEGGTRIGDAVGQLARRRDLQSALRGAVVVVVSDGLERGDPDKLGREMERLSLLAHRIVWVNPLKGDPSYEPLARGMREALRHVDVFTSGHNLASLEDLADLVPQLG